jgi:hypothetical protein
VRLNSFPKYEVVRGSFDLPVYKPVRTDVWNKAFVIFLKLTKLGPFINVKNE